MNLNLIIMFVYESGIHILAVLSALVEISKGTSGCHLTETARSRCSSSPIKSNLLSTSNNLILESKDAEAK